VPPWLPPENSEGRINLAASIMQSGNSVVTIERFIMEQERRSPNTSGELSDLLYDLALAAKIISRQVRRAGLTDILGAAGTTNTSGEQQQKLDVFARDAIHSAVQYSGCLCMMASEEDEEPVPVPADAKVGNYVLLHDPLDGSSNIDVNVSTGTIFSVHRRVTVPPVPPSLADCLQVGRRQVAAGYILYGSSTMLVYTIGQGVHGFTLDPTIGEFLLSHPNMQTPAVGTYYSINESYRDRWTPGVQRVVTAFRNGDGKLKAKGARYIGSLVADLHRNLITGGVFLYPGDAGAPQGKLRLMYEAAPVAMIVEQAGGAATDGRQSILDLVPKTLHQRTPLVVGSKADVLFATEIMAKE
jgi:fructose-1,6-bisphosphatase I